MKHGVSDHAIVRYLERVEGIDLAHLAELIAPADVSDALDGEYPVGDSHMIRVRSGKVVTVYVETTGKLYRQADSGRSATNARGKQHGQRKKRKKRSPRDRDQQEDYHHAP